MSTNDTRTRHAEPTLASSWHAYQCGDETVVAHEREPPFHAAYRVTGTTRNVRAIAAADAVLYDGAVHTVHVDGCEVTLQHHMGGVRERLRVPAWFDEPVVKLDALPSADVTEAIDG